MKYESLKEIEDMVKVTLHWHRDPGVFVDKMTGKVLDFGMEIPMPLFQGSVREWYETFIETIVDVAIHVAPKKEVPAHPIGLVPRGRVATTEEVRVIVPPDLMTLIECSVAYRPFARNDEDLYAWGEIHAWGIKIYKSTEIERNVVLVESPAAAGKILVKGMNMI